MRNDRAKGLATLLKLGFEVAPNLDRFLSAGSNHWAARLAQRLGSDRDRRELIGTLPSLAEILALSPLEARALLAGPSRSRGSPTSRPTDGLPLPVNRPVLHSRFGEGVTSPPLDGARRRPERTRGG